MEVIHNNISAIAKQKGMTVREVEEKAKLPRGIVCKWKTGNPTISNLMKVAEVLKVSVNTLLRESKKKEE